MVKYYRAFARASPQSEWRGCCSIAEQLLLHPFSRRDKAMGCETRRLVG